MNENGFENLNDPYESPRKELIENSLKPKGIKDKRVLKAMDVVPREKFIPERYAQHAYNDTPIPIGFDQTISQPYIVALMLQLLELNGDEVVLEIGGGSGYQAALLGELTSRVYSLELIPELALKARQTLKNLGYLNVTMLRKNASNGYPKRAPFDRIVSAARIDQIPKTWLEQLSEGGIFVGPEGPDFNTKLVRIKNVGESFVRETIANVLFVPLIGDL